MRLRSLTVKQAATHFEQVPKEMVEKIVAAQNSLLEDEFQVDGAAKTRAGKVVSPRLDPRKV